MEGSVDGRRNVDHVLWGKGKGSSVHQFKGALIHGGLQARDRLLPGGLGGPLALGYLPLPCWGVAATLAKDLLWGGGEGWAERGFPLVGGAEAASGGGGGGGGGEGCAGAGRGEGGGVVAWSGRFDMATSLDIAGVGVVGAWRSWAWARLGPAWLGGGYLLQDLVEHLNGTAW